MKLFAEELCAAKRNGSISAEHGLGVMKAPYIGYSQHAETVDAMRQIKGLFDPKSIMNPYKVRLTVASEVRQLKSLCSSSCRERMLPIRQHLQEQSQAINDVSIRH